MFTKQNINGVPTHYYYYQYSDEEKQLTHVQNFWYTREKNKFTTIENSISFIA
jgi:hypothetical protein